MPIYIYGSTTAMHHELGEPSLVVVFSAGGVMRLPAFGAIKQPSEELRRTGRILAAAAATAETVEAVGREGEEKEEAEQESDQPHQPFQEANQMAQLLRQRLEHVVEVVVIVVVVSEPRR